MTLQLMNRTTTNPLAKSFLKLPLSNAAVAKVDPLLKKIQDSMLYCSVNEIDLQLKALFPFGDDRVFVLGVPEPHDQFPARVRFFSSLS